MDSEHTHIHTRTHTHTHTHTHTYYYEKKLRIFVNERVVRRKEEGSS